MPSCDLNLRSDQGFPGSTSDAERLGTYAIAERQAAQDRIIACEERTGRVSPRLARSEDSSLDPGTTPSYPRVIANPAPDPAPEAPSLQALSSERGSFSGCHYLAPLGRTGRAFSTLSPAAGVARADLVNQAQTGSQGTSSVCWRSMEWGRPKGREGGCHCSRGQRRSVGSGACGQCYGSTKK